MRIFASMALLAGIFAPAVPPRCAVAQARHEIVRGRVADDSGRVVRDAQVVVVRLPDNAFKSTGTDANGAYSVDWPDGRGVYTIGVTAPGFAPAEIQARRGADSVIVADVRLIRTAPRQLAAVVSSATRPVPDRDPSSFGAGGSESSTLAQNTARRNSPDLAGDINALAAMLPGVTPVTNGGISVLGLPPSQNAVTLNGMSFSGSDIPRDALTRVRVQASTYDPANGWFSGAQTALDLLVGAQFTSRTGHFMIDAPALEYTDPIGARLGQRFTNLNGSLGGNGQLVDDRWAYNFGVQGGRKTSSVASLLTANDDVLAHAGAAPDSVTRLLSLLARQGIPISASGVPTDMVNDNASFIGRIDHAPFDWNTQSYNPVTFGAQVYGKWGRTQSQSVLPVSTPAHAGTTTQAIGSVTGFYSALFKNTYLADVRSSVTAAHAGSHAYTALPDGRAVVASSLPGGGGVTALQFGGNSSLGSSSQNWRWETMSQLQFYPPALAAHRLKVAADARFDAFSQDPAANTLGTFTYNSLADFAANRPSSFTRTLRAPTRTGGEWNAFLSAGDLWRVSPSWQVLYGVRLDGNAFLKPPPFNSELAQSLGLRTDGAPNGAGLSPRLGFTWQNGKGKILRGGVGQFRNLVDPSLLAAPSAMTGLPDGSIRIACIGDAVPSPDWKAYDDVLAIPSQCNGSSGILTDNAPNVQLIAPAFRPPTSWRANLGYQSSAFRWVYALELLGSLNRNQPGIVDRNFSATTSFTLPLEGRPVFSSPTAIVPSTGLVSNTLARRSASFGQVTEIVSDLRSRSGQVVVDLRPYVPAALRPSFGDVDLSYTLTDIRAQQRGFDGATFGAPGSVEWARGDLDSRHQLLAQWVFRPLRDGRIITFASARIRSGLPFTPMVASDINGDGLANDRAFVFDPARVTDTALAAGLRALTSSAPKRLRECLTKQLSNAAGRNSCEGPWVASMNLGVRLSGQQLLHLPRADVTLNLTNPLGGLDQLLHGADHLRGWGAPAAPDPTLYTVRGFDPVSSQFRYLVNPRFGATSPATSTLRAPFRLTLDVAVDIARPVSEQQLDRWLQPGRSGRPGSKLTAIELTRRYERVVPDPYGELLQQSDSLLLSDIEAQQIQGVRVRYRARADSVWTRLGSFLGNLPDRYDFDEVAKRTDDTIDDVWEMTRRDVQDELPRILAPAQLALLNGWAGQLFRARDRLHIRLAPRAG